MGSSDHSAGMCITDDSNTSITAPSTPPSGSSPSPQSVIDFADNFPSLRLGDQHHVRRKSRLREGARSRRRAKRHEDEPYSPKDDNGRNQLRGGRMVNLSAIGSVLILLFNKMRQNESVARALRPIGKHKRIAIPLLLLLCITFRYDFFKVYRTLFGAHPIQGGYLGRTIDHMFMRRAMEQNFGEQTKALEQLGLKIPIPDLDPKNVLGLRTHAARKEMLVRRELRSRALIALSNAGEDYPKGCGSDKTILPSFLFESTEQHSNCGVPRVLFVPSFNNWTLQRPALVSHFKSLTFDETEMRELVEDVAPALLNTFDVMLAVDDKVHLWALCAVYMYGGIFTGDRLSVDQQSVTDLLLDGKGILGPAPHGAPLAVVKFEKSAESSTKQISVLAATPRHPHLRCVLSKLERASSIDASQILETFFLPSTDEVETSRVVSGDWNQITTDCGYGRFAAQTCCQPGKVTSLLIIPSGQELVQMVSESQGYTFLQLVDTAQPDRAAYGSKHETAVTTVDIVQDPRIEFPVKSRKITLESRLRKKRAQPGWLCTRCIRSPLFGSLDKCASVCPSGYGALMCRGPDAPERADIYMDVNVKSNGAADKAEKSIPRIIHQTYFEDMTMDRYPELVRLQNSWKNSGWEYRFYNDVTAKQYILTNFPSRFADAFDALIPGAYKADLFRYLVLMKEGGIYADVDIMLDTTLDTFITPSMSFFAPRDVVGEYAGEPFCLWNGLIGAAPGHPFIVRAVERLVNLILDRADLYDMEQDICQRVDYPVDTWKVRAEPLLLFSGPCALGVAANEAMNRPSLEAFDIGWLGLEDLGYGGKQDHGDALILVGDKFDTGAFRISDPERNFVVASTELPGLIKNARLPRNPTEGEKRRQVLRKKPLPHYSTSARGTFVWGSRNIYKDDLVSNERLEFNVQYEDARSDSSAPAKAV